jgi:exosortase O
LQQGTGFGFPVRVLTAHTVEMLLQPWHVGAISSQDVIVIENQIALVDLPCSGLKSMWIGSLFLLAASWLQGRRLGWKWLGVATLNLGMLIFANIGRVLALVIVTAVLKQPQLAEVLHVPLGLLGFVLACGCSWWLLRWVPAAPKLIVPASTQPLSRLPHWLRLLPIGVAIGLFGLRLIPGPALPAVPSLADLAWPTSLERQVMPLSTTETGFFGRHTDTQVAKQSFTYGPLSGSMLLVSSRSWRSQHAPELCFVGNGNVVDRLGEAAFPNFSARWLELNQRRNTATYWFQAKQQTTPDFLTRLWSQIRRQEQSWVMVSVLFNQPHQPQEPAVQAFAEMVHQTLQTGLAASNLGAENFGA